MDLTTNHYAEPPGMYHQKMRLPQHIPQQLDRPVTLQPSYRSRERGAPLFPHKMGPPHVAEFDGRLMIDHYLDSRRKGRDSRPSDFCDAAPQPFHAGGFTGRPPLTESPPNGRHRPEAPSMSPPWIQEGQRGTTPPLPYHGNGQPFPMSSHPHPNHHEPAPPVVPTPVCTDTVGSTAYHLSTSHRVFHQTAHSQQRHGVPTSTNPEDFARDRIAMGPTGSLIPPNAYDDRRFPPESVTSAHPKPAVESATSPPHRFQAVVPTSIDPRYAAPRQHDHANPSGFNVDESGYAAFPTCTCVDSPGFFVRTTSKYNALLPVIPRI